MTELFELDTKMPMVGGMLIEKETNTIGIIYKIELIEVEINGLERFREIVKVFWHGKYIDEYQTWFKAYSLDLVCNNINPPHNKNIWDYYGP